MTELDREQQVSYRVVEIAGTSVKVHGSETDPYFQQAEVFAGETANLVRFVQSNALGGVILDVGANIGLTSIAMAISSPSSRILSFEPSPRNAALFRKNLERWENVEVIEAGVGEEEGEINFLVVNAGANCHVTTAEYEYANSAGFRPLRVPVVTLDSFLPKIDAPVSLIKIDVEGYEPNVLSGARELIARYRPWIWLEFNSVTLNIAQGYSPMSFAKALHKSFEVMRLTDGEFHAVPTAGALVHDNIVYHHGLEDILLKPRENFSLVSLEEMVLPAFARR